MIYKTTISHLNRDDPRKDLFFCTKETSEIQWELIVKLCKEYSVELISYLQIHVLHIKLLHKL